MENDLIECKKDWYKIRKMEGFKELLMYASNQALYAEQMNERDDYKLDKYSEEGKLTDEKMSGYYQGRGEMAMMFFYLINDILDYKRKNRNGDN